MKICNFSTKYLIIFSACMLLLAGCSGPAAVSKEDAIVSRPDTSTAAISAITSAKTEETAAAVTTMPPTPETTEIETAPPIDITLSSHVRYGNTVFLNGKVFGLSGDGSTLFSMNPDGSEIQTSTFPFLVLEIMDVYDNGLVLQILDDSAKIIKTNIAGDEKTTLFDMKDNYMWSYSCDKDNIYFIQFENYQLGNLQKLSKASGEKVKVTSKNVYRVMIYEDRLYFDRNEGLYSMDLNGGDTKKLLSDIMPTNYSIMDGWLYFIAAPVSKDKESNKLSKIKPDGKDYSNIGDIEAEVANTAGGMIYFSNKNDENKLYKVKTDGSGVEKLDDTPNAQEIEIVAGRVYFTNADSEHKMIAYSSILPDGSEKIELWKALE